MKQETLLAEGYAITHLNNLSVFFIFCCKHRGNIIVIYKELLGSYMKKLVVLPKEIFYISMTYVGAIVGAGFATGQEVLKFFSFFGPYSNLGILIAASLFSIFGSIILLYGKKLNANSYQEVLTYICGAYLGKILDYAMFIILFGVAGIMLAGAGTVFEEYLALPYNLGTILTCFLAIAILFKGIRGVIIASVLLMPIMIFFGLVISLSSIMYHGVIIHTHPVPYGLITNWLLAAVLYVAYNLMVAMSVLAPLGNNIRTKKTLIIGGFLGGFLIGGITLTMNLAILAHFPQITRQQMPMLYIGHAHSDFMMKVYCIVTWAEVFLIIISNTYGNAVRLSCRNQSYYKSAVIILTLLTLLLSQLGFSYLIDHLYPFFGVVSIWFLGALTLKVLVKICRW